MGDDWTSDKWVLWVETCTTGDPEGEEERRKAASEEITAGNSPGTQQMPARTFLKITIKNKINMNFKTVR